jgi:hypothetical protein
MVPKQQFSFASAKPMAAQNGARKNYWSRKASALRAL